MSSVNTRSRLWRSLLLPLLAMLLWVSLFPMIKIGYAAFGVDTSRVPDILLFAALRFLICGLIVCLIAGTRRASVPVPSPRDIRRIVFLGLFSIVLHYGFLYVGLAFSESSKTALLKQLGSLLYMCFAFLFIKDETFSMHKLTGALVGFAGIAAIHFDSGSFSVSPDDPLILLASLCSVAAFVLSKSSVISTSPLWVTGISQFSGGVILFAAGLGMGGRIPTLNPTAGLVFVCICTASIGGYTLFYRAQQTTSNSTLFIIKFAEPLFACLFSALLLGETVLKVQYLLAFLLITMGIVLGSKSKGG